MAQLNLELLLFADVAQICGTDRLPLTCPPDSTVEHLLDWSSMHIRTWPPDEHHSPWRSTNATWIGTTGCRTATLVP